MGRKQSSLMNMALQMADAMLREQTQSRMQMSKDIAIITAHRVLGMGPGRAGDFLRVYEEVSTEIAALFVTDGLDDSELWYAKAKLDGQLLEILGEENFAPHEKRYPDVYFGKDRLRANKRDAK